MNSLRITFSALVLAMLPAVLDQTILATALPTVASDLGSLSDVSWLVTAYVVAATAATPMWGKLGDRLGRKRMLQTALAWFVIASAICGVAQTLTELVVLRFVQGIAAGGLMTLAMASVGDLVAPRERGRYQGYIAMAFAAATVVGPLIGGVLVDNASWRWVFYVNVPLGVLAFFVLAARLPAGSVEESPKRLDYIGFGLLAGATVALMLACVWGGGRYAWDSLEIVGLFLVAALLAAALVWRERRAADPIVPLSMLTTPVVAIASLALFLGTAGLFAVTVFVPLLLQAGTGASPTEAGLLLVPMMVGTVVSTNVAGRLISATGRYKRFPLLGLGLMTAGLALLAVVAVQNAVDRRVLGTATATTGFFRALGGAVGAAVLGAVFAGRAGHASGSLGGVDPAKIADAVEAVFWAAAPLTLLALLVVLRLPEVELRRSA